MDASFQEWKIYKTLLNSCLCRCVDVFSCVSLIQLHCLEGRQKEREIPYFFMIWLCLCSVRLLTDHNKRVKKRRVSKSFYGFTTTLPLHLTFIYTVPWGSANDFKLINTYRIGHLWWATIPSTERDEQLVNPQVSFSFFIFRLDLDLFFTVAELGQNKFDSHWFCKLSVFKRWERSIILIIVTLQLWETECIKKSGNHTE